MTVISEMTHSGYSEGDCLKCGKSCKNERNDCINRKVDDDVKKDPYVKGGPVIWQLKIKFKQKVG